MYICNSCCNVKRSFPVRSYCWPRVRGDVWGGEWGRVRVEGGGGSHFPCFTLRHLGNPQSCKSGKTTREVSVRKQHTRSVIVPPPPPPILCADWGSRKGRGNRTDENKAGEPRQLDNLRTLSRGAFCGSFRGSLLKGRDRGSSQDCTSAEHSS